VLSRVLFLSRSRFARPNIWRLRGLDAADIAFDRSAAVGQGEPVADGSLVAAEAAGEGMQMRQVADLDGGDPGGQALAVAAGHHLRERGDVAGGGAQLQAAGFDLAELGCLLIGEVAARMNLRTVLGDRPSIVQIWL
jgi:hypothetical protein